MRSSRKAKHASQHLHGFSTWLQRGEVSGFRRPNESFYIGAPYRHSDSGSQLCLRACGAMDPTLWTRRRGRPTPERASTNPAVLTSSRPQTPSDPGTRHRSSPLPRVSLQSPACCACGLSIPTASPGFWPENDRGRGFAQREEFVRAALRFGRTPPGNCSAKACSYGPVGP